MTFIGVLAGFIYSTFSIACRLVIDKGYSSITIITYTVIFASFIAVPLGKPFDTIHTLVENTSVLPYAILFGIVALAIPYCLYTWGLSGIETGKASILVAVEPLVSMVLGVLFYDESSDFFKILGLAMVLSAVVIMNVDFKKFKLFSIRR